MQQVKHHHRILIYMKTSAKLTIVLTIVFVSVLAAMWVPQGIADHYEWWQYLLSSVEFVLIPAGMAWFFYQSYEEIEQEYKKNKH